MHPRMHAQWLETLRRSLMLVILLSSMIGAWPVAHGGAPAKAPRLLDNNANGYHTAQEGATCLTDDLSFAALSLTDLELGMSMLRADDLVAFQGMLDARRIINTKAGLTVYVERRLKPHTYAYIQVRPKGQTWTIWMPAHHVECRAPATKNGQAAARGPR